MSLFSILNRTSTISILGCLSDEKAWTTSELVKQSGVGVNRNKVNASIRDLNKAGLVRSSRARLNRRTRRHKLTSLGRELMELRGRLARPEIVGRPTAWQVCATLLESESRSASMPVTVGNPPYYRIAPYCVQAGLVDPLGNCEYGVNEETEAYGRIIRSLSSAQTR